MQHQTRAPPRDGCNKWICHDLTEYKGIKSRNDVTPKASFSKGPREPKESKTCPKPYLKSTTNERELQVQTATIFLQKINLEDVKPPNLAEVAEVVDKLI